MSIRIRPAGTGDHEAIWAILGPTIRAGETFALPAELNREEALSWWLAPANEVFVAEEGGNILGTYYMHPNQLGGGAHVANCGYMTAAAATGRGVGRAMGEHSLVHAKERGFRAIQFNCVVGTNECAIKLWRSLGFAVVGTLPGAFNHPEQGYVDALVMFRAL